MEGGVVVCKNSSKKPKGRLGRQDFFLQINAQKVSIDFFCFLYPYGDDDSWLQPFSAPNGRGFAHSTPKLPLNLYVDFAVEEVKEEEAAFHTPLNSTPSSTALAHQVRTLLSKLQWLRLAYKIHCRLGYALPGGDAHLKKIKTSSISSAKIIVSKSRWTACHHPQLQLTTCERFYQSCSGFVLPTRFTSGWGTYSLVVMGI